MEYQLIYRACRGGREIQKTVRGRHELLAWLREIATEPIHRETQVISVHEIRKTGVHGNVRRAKRLDVAALTAEACEPPPEGRPLIEIL
jgi:hypothetical protein